MIFFFSLSLSLQGLEPVDEDGFLMGELNGCSGYVPSNLVEPLTDPDELLRVPALLQEQRSGGRGVNGTHSSTEEVDGGGEGGEGSMHKMRALFDYDPAQDSPNSSSELELAVNEGDLVTVFGRPDPSGFFKVLCVCVCVCVRVCALLTQQQWSRWDPYHFPREKAAGPRDL